MKITASLLREIADMPPEAIVATLRDLADRMDADDIGRAEAYLRRRLTGSRWVKIRDAVFARFGRICAYCGGTSGPFDCDHVVPLSRGGTNDPNNLVIACRPCNNSKRDLLLSEWGR